MYRIAPVIIAILFALGGATAPAGAATICKKVHYQGSNPALLTRRDRKAAEDTAIASWELRVAASVGPGWATWENARDRSFRCVRQGRVLKCIARARPCRPD